MCYMITQRRTDEPNVAVLEPYHVSRDEVPPGTVAGFQPLVAALEELGFTDAAWYYFEDGTNGGTGCFVTLRHESGVAVARLWRHAPGAEQEPPSVAAGFVSAIADGTFLVSTTTEPPAPAPPSVIAHAVPGASIEQLWQVHRRAIAASSAPAVTMSSEREADAIQTEYHRLACEHYLELGIFDADESMPEETEVGQQDSAARDDLVLQQIERLENKRGSWTSAIVILVVSLVFFLVIGVAAWRWETLASLIFVLLFHEGGHYVAMRVFGYRNVRMFFIPFFGAAVSGRHYNVPGWKKILVSFAGPVPGIVLGTILGVTGLAMQQRWLLDVALLMLLLNAFNLLPFLPFDGGWIAHAALFSRQPWLDAGFRAIAGLALIGGGLFRGFRILLWVGSAVLIGVPTTYRIAQVAARLRREKLAPEPQGDHVPRQAARHIIQELRRVMPDKATDRQLAQATIRVYENVNARPPGVLATIVVVVAHVMSLAFACGAFFLLIVLQQMDNAARLDASAVAPRQAVVVEQLRSVKPRGLRIARDQARISIVAVFPRRASAVKAFDFAGRHCSRQMRAVIMGQTIVLDLPATATKPQQAWRRQFLMRGAALAVNRRPFEVAFRLECVAPSEKVARAIEQLRRWRQPIDAGAKDGPKDNGRPNIARERTEVKFAVRRNGQRLVFEPARFANPYDGLLAFIKWLYRRGCTNVYFGVSSGPPVADCRPGRSKCQLIAGTTVKEQWHDMILVSQANSEWEDRRIGRRNQHEHI